MQQSDSEGLLRSVSTGLVNLEEDDGNRDPKSADK